MKKILKLVAIQLFVAMSAYSQQPASGFSNIFNYQGVARNSVGNVLANKSIALRLTIHDVNPGGPVVYQETRGVVTNPFGLFNVQVGSVGATNVTGAITSVNWAINNKYIQVEIDPNGGNTFINIGTAQMAFVPYALYSSLAGDLVLPFNKTQANAGTLFTITNSGTGISGSIMGITNSPAANAWGVHGQVNNSSAGGFSTGVLGTNLSTTGLGIGVTGTQNGSGWGVYGTAPSGIGVNGASTSGNGVNGSSVTGAGGRFVTTGSGQALFTTGALRFQGILEGTPNPPNLFKILAGDATGNASWQHASAIGLVSGSGTLNFVPKWTPNGTTLGNSQIFDDGTQVGVGTITPFARLTVVQNNSGVNLGGGAATGSEIKFLNAGTSHMSIYNRGNNALTFAQTSALSQTNTLGSPLMTLTSGGNLGIGTTTPLHTLEVQGIERINATTVQEGGELRFQEGSLFGAPNHWIIDNFQSFAGGNKFRLWNDVGGMNIQMMPGGKTAIGNMIFSDQPRSTLDVEGNLAVGAAYSGTTAAPVNGAIIEGSVGIGITAPLDKLHVAGTVAQVRIEDTDNASTLWLSAPGSGYTGGVGMLTNNDLPLFTNNIDRITIKAGTGHVGIGTATPLTRLHVAGQATIQDGTQGIGKIYVDDGAGVGTGKWSTPAGAGIVSGSGTLNFVAKWTPNGTTLGNSKIFDNGFNVGIGTTVPNWPLHISANISGIRIQDADNNNSIYLLAPGTGYTGGLGTDENFDIPIYTNNIDRLTVKAGTGHVGIGTTTPLTRLHVAGQATIQDGTQGIGKIFVDDGAGVGTGKWSTASGAGIVSGSGTLNFIPKWTPNGTTLGNSQVFDNGFAVGIGTTSPVFKLQVADNFPELLVQDIDDATSISVVPRGTGYTGGVGTRGNNDLPLFTNNLDRVTIKAGTGDVGVNTVSPLVKFHVNSGNNFNTSLLEARDINNAGPHQYFYSGGEFGIVDYIRSDYIPDATRRGALEVRGVNRLNLSPTGSVNMLTGMTILGNGNVGIGTASPLFKVDVSSTVAVQRLIDTDDGTIFGIAAPGTGYSGGVGTVSNHDLAIFSNNFDRMTVRANGDVGVGITAPTNKFEVLQMGITRAGLFQVNNPASFATALEVNSNGTGIGIHAQSNTPGFCNCGVIDGLTNVTGANAVFGRGIGSNTWGVYGLSDSSAGVAGIGFRAGSVGVYGQGWRGTAGQFVIDNTLSGNTSNALEVSNTQTGKAGNFVINNTASTSDVIFATTNGFGNAIETFSDKSTSIVGRTGLNAGYGSAGVLGINNSLGGNGLYGTGNRVDDWGLLAHSDSSIGVYSESYYDRAGYFVNFGLNNTTANAVEVVNLGKGHGVYAQTSHYNQLANFYNPATAFKAAGYFNGNAGTGVIGHAAGTFTHTAGGRVGVGVYGVADSVGSNFNYGIVGVGRGSVGENAGVIGYVDGASGGTFNAAIYGVAFAGPGTRYAGYFDGNVQVIGNFAATGSKAFKIDHPLDPANKYLSHFAMESPEVQNVYNGNVITDANGKASIKLPEYFSGINKDFKYQLTVVDETQFAMARVSKKINGNNFEIMTSEPNMEVSWQVTAVRNDKAAQQFVESAETLKQDGEKGRYLNPELYGQGKEKGIAAITGGLNIPGNSENLKTAKTISNTSEKMLNLQRQGETGKTNEQKQNGSWKVSVPELPKLELEGGKKTNDNSTSPDDPSQKSKVLASSLKPVEEVQYKTTEIKQATLTEAEMERQQKVTTVEQKDVTEAIRKSWNNEGKPADPSVKQLPATLAEDKLPKPEKLPAETKQQQPKQIKESPQPVLHGMPEIKPEGLEKAPVQKQETKLPTRSQPSPELQKTVQPGPLKQVANDELKEKTKTD